MATTVPTNEVTTELIVAPVQVMKKSCSTCGETKLLSEFSANKRTKDGKKSYCKSCAATYMKSYVSRREFTVNYSSVEKEMTCKVCQQAKSHSEFDRNKLGSNGYSAECKKCKSERNKIYKRVNRDKIREYSKSYTDKTYRYRHLRRKYNLTVEEYEEALANQGGVCAICGKPETARHRYGPIRLAVDHDHITGEFRGLLCSGCNTGLGKFQDNHELLQKAVEYLKH